MKKKLYLTTYIVIFRLTYKFGFIESEMKTDIVYGELIFAFLHNKRNGAIKNRKTSVTNFTASMNIYILTFLVLEYLKPNYTNFKQKTI